MPMHSVSACRAWMACCALLQLRCYDWTLSKVETLCLSWVERSLNLLCHTRHAVVPSGETFVRLMGRIKTTKFICFFAQFNSSTVTSSFCDSEPCHLRFSVTCKCRAHLLPPGVETSPKASPCAILIIQSLSTPRHSLQSLRLAGDNPIYAV